MATCATCGREFRGFSFGASPATQCPDCRKQAAAQPAPAPVSTTPQFVVAVPAIPIPIVTYIVLGANVAVYLAMCLMGVSWLEPNSMDALRWGADFAPLTLGGEWWRLFTSMFVHFGIVHIGFNMWCFYNLGRSLEFLMGRKAFAATYVASGVAASIVSIWVHPLDVGAGASGAIFGTAGTFAAYVFLKRVALSPRSLKATRNSLAAFIVYNLAFGAVIGHIDNSAHVGGLIAGAILGAIVPPIPRFRVRGAAAPVPSYPVDRTAEESHANRIAWGIIFGSGIVLAAAFLWVRSVERPYAEYGEAVKLIQRGQANRAITLLGQTLQGGDIGDQFAPAQMLLGEALLDQGNANAAISPLARAASVDSTDYQTLQNLALAHIGIGDHANALQEINQVLAAEKDKPGWDAAFIHAVATGESGDYALAARELQSVIVANPTLTEAQADMARFQGLAGQRPEGTLPPLAVPYAKLVVKSEAWPIFP